ncbi:MAG: MarR family transcriptional regulator [Nocardioidaceae bacterium]|nr:MarR family transcriptional regulator [Nocardioidaceae bacterium]NUS50830.1 MarR family transcriptional regulator [Nocardioidaceae bacterium]
MSQRTATPTLQDLSVELSTYLGRLTRALSRSTPGDVPTASLRLLGQIDELEPVAIGALAAADRCSQPTMSAGVLHLVDRGWAVKSPNPADARSSLVRLTDAGRTVLGEARRHRATDLMHRLQADPAHDEQDVATAVAVLRGLLEHSPTHDTRAAEGTA